MYLPYFLCSVFVHARFLYQSSGALPISVKQSCQENEFRCVDDGTCISKAWVCDYSYDCMDKSDEIGCGEDNGMTKASSQEGCNEDEFMCKMDKYCITKEWVCDKSIDCIDNSDEMNCGAIQCKEKEVRCKTTGHCIEARWVCDGESDCIDNSDEENCFRETILSTTSVTETIEELTSSTRSDDSDLEIILKSNNPEILFSIALNDTSLLQLGTSHAKETTVLPFLESSLAPTFGIVSNDETNNYTTKDDYAFDQDNSTSLNNFNTSAQDYSTESTLSDISTLFQKYEIPHFFAFSNPSVDYEYEGGHIAEVDISGHKIEDSSTVSSSSTTSVLLNTNLDSEITSTVISSTFTTLPTTTSFDVTTAKQDFFDISTFVTSIATESLSSTTTPTSDNTITVPQTSDITTPTSPPKTTTATTTETMTPTTTPTTTTTTTPTTTSTTTMATTPTATFTTTATPTTTSTTTTTPTTTSTTTTPYPCRREEFFCRSDSTCIPIEWRCDLTEDCWDGSDERNCNLVRCPSEMVQCHNSGRCIYPLWICDGSVDCENGSDEFYCK